MSGEAPSAAAPATAGLPDDGPISIEAPMVEDGVDCWRIARDSQVLDVNSRYAYLLWCRDFARTSVVARRDGQRPAVVGFVTGYRRPDDPRTLMVWQVAVDARARGQGLAGRMLDALYDRVAEVDHLETTVTPSNEASIALFTGFAQRRGAEVDVTELFTGAQLSGPPEDGPAGLVGNESTLDEHEPENRYRIGPIPDTASPT